MRRRDCAISISLLFREGQAGEAYLSLNLFNVLYGLLYLRGEVPVIGRHAHEGGDGVPVEGKLVVEGEGVAQAEVGSKLLDDVLLLILFDGEQGELLTQGLEMVGAGDDDEQ